MKMETIRSCSIWRALDVVGDVPVLLIMERAFLGEKSFEGFVSATKIARSIISNRLKKLVYSRVFTKAPKANTKRNCYFLTEKGRSLFPTALMILRWQHLWEPDNRPIKVHLVHSNCGKPMEPIPNCRHCNEVINPREVSWAPGPGLSQITPIYARRRKQTETGGANNNPFLMNGSAIALFGDRWSTLVIRACFTGINRFDDIQRDTLMATNILSERLSKLLESGIIKAFNYSTRSDRFEYRLTQKGRDLYPVLLALLEWGDAWFADKMGPPLLLNHKPCSHSLSLDIVCSECGEPANITNLRFAKIDHQTPI